MTLGWHLVLTKPLSEYRAAGTLERNGYELFFPRIQTPRPRPGHSDTPLFPRYLFVREENGTSNCPPVNRMEGLVGWVQFDGAVPTVPDEVISELESRLHRINNSGGYWTRFRPGDRVQVASGMLEGLAEVVEESKSPEARVRVMLNFMGRLVPARVPWSDLRPIRDDLAPVYEARPPRRTRGKGRWVRGFGPRGVADASTSRA